ncbi:cytochrome P450 [Dactylonectria macrodidyma]|uniref:Cytochrome P450 n=1 Tax=Dactylonectria macrodidyma TaxID=307937 RepID=A0A9P9ER07_9HYPO|nr:cytochrome P450 [Dactylonectria macrodidyma]
MITTLLQLVFVLLAFFLIYLLRSGATSLHGLPPGPRPLPIVGNIKDLPPQGVPEFEHWLKFKDAYGPLISMTVLGTTLVVIHSHEAAQELLVKKSTKTARRPDLYFADKMCGFGGLTPNLSYGITHRLHRKFMHQEMGSKTIVQKFYGIQDEESRRFLLRVLNDPDNTIEHIKTEASAIILKITYGYSIEPHEADPLVGIIERMMDSFSRALVPMAWPVDILPWLRHLPSSFPGASFKQTARDWREITRQATEIPYRFVQEQMTDGNSRPSYVASLLEQYCSKDEEGWKLDGEGEEVIKNSAVIIYGGGADTTVSTISSFVLAMVLYPEVQLRAQEEIDRVVGTDRMPTFEDRDHLPYINALIKETLRWLPVVPIGTTHVAEEEITYAGYRIPKGAYLLPAIWWFLHDPEIHPEPSIFDPERFLEPRNEPDPANHAFGYGRRICPGRYLADDNLFLTISRMLATFNIQKAIDEQGRTIEAKVGMTAGLISHPIRFPYSIKPRSAKHVKLVRFTEVNYPWDKSDAVHLGGGILVDGP